jgi:hypothetical protein
VESMWHNTLQDMPPHMSRWLCHSPGIQVLVSHCRVLGSNLSVIIMDETVKDEVCLKSITSLVSKFGASYLSLL